MRRLSVASLMTSEVITAIPETPFKDLALLMRKHSISAVPIVEGDYAVGVVSEADLLPKEEFRGGTTARPAILSSRAEKRRWRRALGGTAREVMTTPVRTIRMDASASTAAGELAKAGVRRLFVVDVDGALVGVLSRRDLLKVFVKDDEALRAEIQDEVFGSSTWINPATVDITVHDGVVTMRGLLERRSDVDLAAYFVRALPGVVSLENNLAYEWDDTQRPRRVEMFG
ncbi:CBS domain-containing protein [Lentzea nigeriaca]|uniref:CBS domain-containing protein n=1 Tax=Lentzea nigeriaca TaxID=1128665 RepID=UPI00195EF076|nr:CBS domain-containing protein [Lentzea nigeriaca]MBM7863731.1 CBS domain-containing protein [Lentzea nigeriaca]